MNSNAIVGIYLGNSHITVYYSNGNQIRPLQILGDNFSYPICHRGKAVYGHDAMGYLFTEPDNLVTNLVYLSDPNNLNGAEYKGPCSVRRGRNGDITVTDSHDSIQSVLYKLFDFVFQRIARDLNRRAIHIIICKPNNFQGKAFNVTMETIIKAAKNVNFCIDDNVETVDCITAFILFQNVKISKPYFLVVDENYTYWTSAYVTCPPNFPNVQLQHINCPPKLSYLSKLVCSLISLIRNSLIEEVMMSDLLKEGLHGSTMPQYILLNKQVYTFIACHLTQYKSMMVYPDFTYCVNDTKYTVSKEKLKDICERWINKFVEAVIRQFELKSDCPPDQTVYIIGDYGNLFTSQKVDKVEKRAKYVYCPNPSAVYAMGAIRSSTGEVTGGSTYMTGDYTKCS